MVGRGSAYFTVVNRAGGTAVANAGCGYEGADIRLADRRDDPCQQWRPEDRGGGYASLLNRFSNKVAEVAACVNADGARVAQWGWLANDCQRFRVLATDSGWSRVESQLSGRVLTAAGCGGAGAAIQTVTWAGSACQQFRFDPVGDVLLTDAAGRRVLDVAGCGRTAGRAAVTAGRRAGRCQLWRFVPTAEGWYRILNARSGRALGSARHGGALVLVGSGGWDGTAGEWRIEAVNDGTYHLVDRATGDVVDLGGPIARQVAPTAAPAVRLLIP
jgi:hypothetical protein